MSPDDPAATPSACLHALAGAYAGEPDRAEALLGELFALLPRLDRADDRLQAARLAGEMALERRDPRAAEACIAAQLQAAPCPPAIEAELRCYLARAAVQQQRFDEAREQLQTAESLAGEAALPRAMLLAARAQLAHREGEIERSAQFAQAALQRFAGLGWRGPWVQAYSTLALARRELGLREARAEALREGLARCREQRRWGEACNLATGLFDMAVEDGDLPRAEAALREAETLAARESGGPDAPGKAMARFSRSRWLAARGRHAEACADLREALAAQRHRLVAYELALRLDQLADWLLLCGQPEEAQAAAAEAQQIELQQLQRALARDLALQQQALQVEQAERERVATELHARRMEQQRAALAQTLARQRELHAELVEARKMAGLGELLIALSRSLQGPLAQGEAALAGARQGSEQLLAELHGGQALSRRRLQGLLRDGVAACAQGQQGVERAIAELATYKALRDGG